MAYTIVLEKTVFTAAQIGEIQGRHIALAGRSNVGKSSLVNKLSGRRKNLAKVSATPGKTRSLNFYQVEGHPLTLVDLPGYGYARCAKSEREAWAKLIEKYFQVAGPALAAVATLLDCRLPPQKIDLELTSWLHSLRIPIIPVLTKADKCTQTARASRAREWETLLGGVTPVVFSSKTGMGFDALWEKFFEAAS